MWTNSRLEYGLGVIVLIAWTVGVFVYIDREWHGRGSQAPQETFAAAAGRTTQALTGSELASWLEGMDTRARSAINDYDGALRLAHTAGDRPVVEVYLERVRRPSND